MVFVYPNTLSTFVGSEETAFAAGYVNVEDDVYADLLSTKKKWDNGEIVDDPIYETRKAEEEAAAEMRAQADAVNTEIASCKARLRELDYIGVKIATGRATIEEYTDEIAEMTRLANRINELEGN